jgi:hypothetical protein
MSSLFVMVLDKERAFISMYPLFQYCKGGLATGHRECELGMFLFGVATFLTIA